MATRSTKLRRATESLEFGCALSPERPRLMIRQFEEPINDFVNHKHCHIVVKLGPSSPNKRDDTKRHKLITTTAVGLHDPVINSRRVYVVALLHPLYTMRTQRILPQTWFVCQLHQNYEDERCKRYQHWQPAPIESVELRSSLNISIIISSWVCLWRKECYILLIIWLYMLLVAWRIGTTGH